MKEFERLIVVTSSTKLFLPKNSVKSIFMVVSLQNAKEQSRASSTSYDQVHNNSENQKKEGTLSLQRHETASHSFREY